MEHTHRVQIIFHGAIVVFVGLLCGFAAVWEVVDEQGRLWRSAHLGLLMTGIWLFATSAVLPLLVLRTRDVAALKWSLFATAYGFMAAVVLEAATGTRAFQLSGSVANLIAFLGNIVGVFGALLATLLTLEGARAALRSPQPNPPRFHG